MQQSEKRSIAVGAAKAQLRRMGFNPACCTPDDAFRVLEDMALSEPDLIASAWWRDAPEAQVNLFVKEWRRWQNS